MYTQDLSLHLSRDKRIKRVSTRGEDLVDRIVLWRSNATSLVLFTGRFIRVAISCSISVRAALFVVTAEPFREVRLRLLSRRSWERSLQSRSRARFSRLTITALETTAIDRRSKILFRRESLNAADRRVFRSVSFSLHLSFFPSGCVQERKRAKKR